MIGVGHAACHHGEIVQGVFLDDDGHPCRGLVTLPTPEPSTRAEFLREDDVPVGRIVVTPEGRAKAARAAALAVNECALRVGVRPSGGRLRLRGEIPVGLGMGSSTSDIIAAVRAVASAYRCVLSPSTIARLAVRAETASDPLMLDHRPVLFAQREGRVLEELGAALPPLVVVSCLTGDGAAVDTLAPRPEHQLGDVPAFELLRAQLRTAIANGSAALLGAVCTESSRLNQRLLPKPELDALEAAAAAAGAVGVQVAHSGNVAGVLFDAEEPDLEQRLHSCVARLRRSGVPVSRVFGTTRGKEEQRARPHHGGDRHTRPGAPRRGARLPSL